MKKQNKTAIPVFLSSDDNYAPYMGTCAHSILENSKAQFIFYLLIPPNFAQKSKRSLQKLAQLYPNCQIKFVNMGVPFPNLKQKIPHLTWPSYYRLLIAERFPELDKCVYLDVDTLVCGDLAEFYAHNIEGYYYGGVKAPYVYLDRGGPAYLRSMGLRKNKNYFNAGVLLMNLKKIRTDNLTPVFKKLAWRGSDQEILNIAGKGNVKMLDFKYNCMTKYFFSREKLYPLLGRKMVENAFRQPVIIHYCAKAKPWQFPIDERFWQSARRSPFYAEILERNMQLKPAVKPKPSFWTKLFRRNG